MGKRHNHAHDNAKRPRGDDGNQHHHAAGEVGRDADEDNEEWPDALDPSQLTNAHFESYYRNTFRGMSVEDWNAFLDALRRPLPSTFRITPLPQYELRIRRAIRQFEQRTTFPVMKLPESGGRGANGNNNTGSDSSVVAMPYGPREIGPWNPTAWTTHADRKTLRKTPLLKELHRVLVRASESGLVSRQELVSMIPAMCFDVTPGDWILDTCAAPGSKTLQLLELLHSKGNGEGLLVANDVDSKRSYMLFHRVRAVTSPCLVVTTQDAGQIPYLPRAGGGEGTFDKILCDVPCSGDGTMRKNPNLWRKFTVRDGTTIHPMQTRIAARAVGLLRVGGTLVYSTCSFNPVEDEAVVAHLLREFPNLELVDMSSKLPGLKRRAGMRGGWKVPYAPVNGNDNNNNAATNGADFTEFSTYAEFQAFCKTLPEASAQKEARVLRESMFPPLTQEEEERMKLDRTMRLFPQDQDSGGFFVAVLTKTRPSASNAPPSSSATTTATTSSHHTREPSNPGANAVWFDDVPEGVWNTITTTYGLAGVDRHRFVARMDSNAARVAAERASAGGGEPLPPTKISLVSNSVVEFLNANAAKTQATSSNGYHIVNGGVVVFVRGGGKEHKFEYRACNEGLRLVQHYITKRVVAVTLENLKQVHTEWIKFNAEQRNSSSSSSSSSSSAAEPRAARGTPQKSASFSPFIQIEKLPAATRTALEGMEAGGIVIKLLEEERETYKREMGGEEFAMAGWYGKKDTVSFMVDHEELQQFFEQLFDRV